MKKNYFMLMLLAASSLFAKAEVFTSEHLAATKGKQVKGNVQADTYYIISGIDQSNREYYLYDNGSQVKGSAAFPESSEDTGAHIWTLSVKDGKWVIANVGTGNKMNLGSGNGSAISTGANEQVNAIHFSSDGYMTILNSNGQAIDMTANGANPTTWTGTSTPSGSRRLKIYEAENVQTKISKSLSLLPAPKSAIVGEGEYILKEGFTIGVQPFSESEMQNRILADVSRFISTINAATGLSCQAANANVDITISEKSDISKEGYILDISAEGVSIKASSATGVYYAMQSLMRLLPANVILGKPSLESQTYSLPVARIEDEPRFPYRGFMLDVSRHFFTIEEVKKMIDLMAIYKMNVFHWHLTDDQGWRAEIKQYPLLTTIGAERRSSYDTPITKVVENGQTYWTGSGAQTNRKYGPFYYTQEEMKDVVRYAAERHIDILPEVDMPGHFVAALHAYPEFCCHPERAPEVWITGGVSQDVLNVANPAAVQFAKNIITELCAIFPYPYFHIGGDECPTTQWESNALCQAKLKEMGKTSYRALQTEFIREINEHLGTLGKKIFCWNESITDNGADLDLMKQSGATIMCWNPCQSGAAKAASLGLNAIITEWGSGCYYINRRQSNDYGEPTGAGYGGDNVASTYNYVPVPANISAEQAKHYIGVQATFWAEHVSSNEYLEYAALPRFMCIAEAGWTPQEQKNWNSFVRRMTVDTEMLDLGEYVYARHWMKDYVPRQAPAPTISDGSVVTFTNYSSDRGRCLADIDGNLNAQASECTSFTLEEVSAGSGTYYIKSNVSGKYLYASSNTSGTMVKLHTIKTVWAFDTSTINGYVAICYKTTSNNAINNNASTTTKARLFTHGSGNGSSFWKIDAFVDTNLKEGEKGSLTYNYYHRGLVVATKSFSLTCGDAYPSFADHMPNGYVAVSGEPIQGTVHLVNETIEIPVETVPVSNAFYHFFNPDNGMYFCADATSNQHGVSASTQPNTIFYYSGNDLLSYERGLYVNGASLSAENASVVLLPSKRGTLDMCNIISNYNDFICIADELDATNTLGTSADASAKANYDFAHRKVLSLPVSLPESGWTTFSAPVATTVPAQCNAYVVESYDASTATAILKLLSPGVTIAPNTGVLLNAVPNAVVEMVITEHGAAYADNMLQPSIATTVIPTESNAYVLVSDGNNTYFAKVADSMHSAQPHSSWLKVDGSVSAEKIYLSVFNGETGIYDSLGDSSLIDNGIYNLHGQRLNAKQKGINIINGKKVLVE